MRKRGAVSVRLLPAMCRHNSLIGYRGPCAVMDVRKHLIQQLAAMTDKQLGIEK